MPTDHEARSHTHAAGTAAGGTSADHTRESFGGIATREAKSGNTTIQSKRVNDRGSQAQREVQNEVSVQNFEACPATYKSGPHVARRNHDHADGEVAN